MENWRRTYFPLILAMLAWGSLYPVSKHLMTGISPLFLAFIRYLTATVALLPFFIIEISRNNNRFTFKSLTLFTISGFFGVALFAVLLFLGISLTTASKGSILTNTQPVFTAILAPLLLKESLSGVQATGIFTGLIGIFLVVSGGDLGFFSGGNSVLTGSLLLLGASVSMCLYSIILKSSIITYGGIVSTWFSMAAGTLILFIINISTGLSDFKLITELNYGDLFLIIYMGIIATALAYLLFNLSLKKIDVIRATGFKFLIPVSGVSLSVIFLGERPAIASYAGILIVIFSIFLIQRNVYSKSTESMKGM